jgi:hypothetical protein
MELSRLQEIPRFLQAAVSYLLCESALRHYDMTLPLPWTYLIAV